MPGGCRRAGRCHDRMWAFLVLFFLFISSAYAAPDAGLQALFADEADEMMVERLPLETEPVALGLFALTDDERDRLERPNAITAYLTSFAGVPTFHSQRVMEDTAAHSATLVVQRLGEELIIEPPSDADDFLFSACRLIAEYPGKPVTVDVFASSVKEGEDREKRVVDFMSRVLARHPDEIETILQIDPAETQPLKIHVLGIMK